MQTDNRVLDGMARFFTNAAGAAQAFRVEMETMIRSRVERLIAELDFVPREEFDVVRAMAVKARSENEKLAARVVELESKLAARRKFSSAKTSPNRPKRLTRRRQGKL